jgi:hypothetical protein
MERAPMSASHHITHCALRLGDNLAALHFLRSLAIANPSHRFTHYAHLTYLAQLSEVVCDLPNLQVCSLESVSESPNTAGGFWSMKPHFASLDLWKNAHGHWARHPLRLDYAQFYFAFCAQKARAMGLAPEIWRADQIPFNYSALTAWQYEPFDFLVVNSHPQSGQLPAYNDGEMNRLVGALVTRGYRVITTSPTPHPCGCTRDHGMTVSQIGALSRFCKYIVAVSTGSSWTTFNTFNNDTVALRVVLIEKEEVKISPRTVNVNNVSGARHELTIAGLL